ncbi:uncharacterized protein LOC128279142 [Anopheles cruzii]|uniref:uncharacterized protein LOC128279142 n=1 Tax=Anopheles cruzii TaxID=68878 RepID=UPI0022EC4894|nr:uncharacterized protein LOC128279142 [Anopheles cruzii]
MVVAAAALHTAGRRPRGRSDALSRSRISLRSETTGSSGAASSEQQQQRQHALHPPSRGHRRHSSQQSLSHCPHHRQHGDEEREERERCQREEDETAGEEDVTAGEEDEEEEEVAGTTATCTEDERHAAGSVSTMYAENCHCSRGNLTTTDDDDEIQQYFIVDHTQQQPQHHVPPAPQRSVSRRPSVSSGASRRSTPRSRRGTTTPMSCCSHHSQPPGMAAAAAASYQHHQHHHPQRFTDPESPAAVSRRTDSGSNATISNFNINPARFQCSYYTADESENSYCSISGENIRQIQAQTAIQHRLDREEQKQRLVPLPLQPPDQPAAVLATDTDSQQDVASLNESILSTGVESTSSDQRGPADGGSTTTTTSTTTTSTTQRQLLHQVGSGGPGSGGRGTPKSAGSQLVLTPSKITIENIGQLSELGRTESYEFDDLDINIPEIFQSPSKIKWSFLAHLDESKSNKSRISSVSSLVDAASSGRGRSGTESGGADVSETASDNEYSPNRIRRRRPEPLPSEAVGGGPSGGQQPVGAGGIQASSSSCKIEELLKKSSPSASSDFKTVSIWRAENGDEGNAIIFHHESEIVENCCTNHFLDHSNYDVCRVDNCDYLIRSSDTDTGSKRASCGTLCKSEERLNNAIAPSASLAKQLELKQRNVFTTTAGPGASMSGGASTTPTLAATAPTATVYSIISPDLKRFEKQTNLNRHSVNLSQNLPASPTSSSSTSSIFAGNYGGSSVYRNINHHHQPEAHHGISSDYDKLVNTTAGTLSRGAGTSSRSRLNTAPPSTGSRSATSTLRRLTTTTGGSSTTTFNNQTTPRPHSNNNYYDDGARTLSTASLRGPPVPPLHDAVAIVTTGPEPGDPALPPFSISAGAETAAAAAASQFYNKSYHYNLTAQNQLYFQAFSNAVREQEQQNCEFHQHQPQTPSPQPQPSCPQCYEYYGCQAQYYANATNEADSEFAEANAAAAADGGGGSSAGPGGGVMRRRGGWRRNVGTTLRINGLVRVVRTRARKCADYIRQKEHQSNNRFRRRK